MNKTFHAHHRPKGEASKATPEKEFDILFGIAQQNWNACFDFIYRHGMFISLAAAFILGAKAKSIFMASSYAPLLACLFFLLLTGLHYFWLNGYRKRSIHILDQLGALNFIGSERYRSLRVTRKLVYSVQAYHSVLVILICISLSMIVVSNMNHEHEHPKSQHAALKTTSTSLDTQRY